MIVDDATLCFRKRFKFRKRSKGGEVDVCFCKRFNAGEAEIFPIGQIHLSIDLTGGAGDHLAARGMSNCAFGTCQGIGSTAGSTEVQSPPPRVAVRVVPRSTVRA